MFYNVLRMPGEVLTQLGGSLKIEGFKSEISTATRLRLKKDNTVLMIGEEAIASPYGP